MGWCLMSKWGRVDLPPGPRCSRRGAPPGRRWSGSRGRDRFNDRCGGGDRNHRLVQGRELKGEQRGKGKRRGAGPVQGWIKAGIRGAGWGMDRPVVLPLRAGRKWPVMSPSLPMRSYPIADIGHHVSTRGPCGPGVGGKGGEGQGQSQQMSNHHE